MANISGTVLRYAAQNRAVVKTSKGNVHVRIPVNVKHPTKDAAIEFDEAWIVANPPAEGAAKEPAKDAAKESETKK